ncbi:helix-turn-helix transcriptional regulator [Kytococcus sp. Marseille-QA3725]
MTTTARLLRVLGMLQSRAVWTGPELAGALGITERTVRRDVERLRELGYPVEAGRGREGGYRLGRGRSLPPLVLEDDEAVAAAVALRLGAGGVAGTEEAALRALTKLDQVLPARLRPEVAALASATETLPPWQDDDEVTHHTLMTTARAVRDRVRLRFTYRRRDGEEALRTTEPLRLVATGRRWYLVAFDLDRDDWRSFRLDRIRTVRASTWRSRERPAPDPVEFVLNGLRAGPYPVVARIKLTVPVRVARRRIPATVAEVSAREQPDGTEHSVVEVGAPTAEEIARHMVFAALDLGAELTVLDPPEVQQAVADLARRVGRWG